MVLVVVLIVCSASFKGPRRRFLALMPSHGYVPVLRPHVGRGRGNGQDRVMSRRPGRRERRRGTSPPGRHGNPADSRAGNVMWMLFVGGRAYAGRNGDLQESC